MADPSIDNACVWVVPVGRRSVVAKVGCGEDVYAAYQRARQASATDGAHNLLELGAFRMTPKLDLFNALNSDDYSSVSTVQYGAATYMQPSVIIQGRIIRVGVDVSW